MVHLWELGQEVLGMPRRHEHPKPAFPLPDGFEFLQATEEQAAIFTNWKRQMAEWYTSDLRRKGSVIEAAGQVKILRELRDREVWFPVFLDFRQRMYYSGSPNPQGTDGTRSVLHFAEKKALGSRGVFWLKVHIANCFGFDKADFPERVAWVDERWDTLAADAVAPEDSDLYRAADAPLSALAAVRELAAAYASGDPKTYRTGLPIHMDATCSGLQHFSAILRDPVGAKYTNLLDCTGSKADIYTRVGEVAQAQFRKDAANPLHKYQLCAQLWLDLDMPRSMVKKPVMTYVYGATKRNVALDIASQLDDTGFRHEAASVIAMANYAADVIFSSIEATVPAAAACMRWLRERARAHGTSHTLTWKTRFGLLVGMDSRKQVEKRVPIRSLGLSKVVVRDTSDELNPRRTQNSISPNLIHSLDATHLSMVAERMQADGLSMVCIHDSFGTHPSDVDRMHQHIREAFVDLYAEYDPLAELLRDLGQDVETPLRGDFNIREVLSSRFFFC
jgi:DNA-directed RNA polymerase